MDWEEKYQADDCPWDHGEAAPGLQEWLSENSFTGKVIVPGCGLGHDARQIAECCPDCEVIGLDLSETAIEKAKQFKNPENVRFINEDLFELPDGLIQSADWVFEHTCLCALPIDLRPKYLKSVHNLLKPGGQYLAVFFINPDMDPGEDGPPFGINEEEIEELFLDHFSIEKTWSPNKFYDSRIGRELMGKLIKK